MKRTITVEYDDAFINATIDAKAAREQAIGYLATWAIHSDRHKSVAIKGDKEGNLHATYRNVLNETTYTLFAQNTAGVYSFHS